MDKLKENVGNEDGGSKTSGGGWKAIGKTLIEVCMCDKSLVDVSINVYSTLDEYIDLRDKRTDCERYFCDGSPFSNPK